LPNILHGFRFVNPLRVPGSCTELALTCPAELRPLGVTPSSLAKAVQASVDFDLSLKDNREKLFDYRSDFEKLAELRALIRSVGKKVRERAETLATQSTVAPDSTWGQSVIAGDGGIVPHLTWFDFFNAANQGSTIVTVPDDPGIPPDSPDPPGDVSFASGIGLTLIAGPGAVSVLHSTLRSHVEYWTRSVLEPPAAVIAYESFSRSLEFIEYRA